MKAQDISKSMGRGEGVEGKEEEEGGEEWKVEELGKEEKHEQEEEECIWLIVQAPGSQERPETSNHPLGVLQGRGQRPALPRGSCSTWELLCLIINHPRPFQDELLSLVWVWLILRVECSGYEKLTFLLCYPILYLVPSLSPICPRFQS